MDLAAFDWSIYWFMFPISIVIATTAMLSGIGGAAMFTPIFMIIFPILGPEYPFPSIAAAIGVALFTETFGFSSGFIGYFHKRLIDFRSAIPFIAIGVPIGIVGAILLTSFKEYEEVLRGAYAILMLILSVELIRYHDPAIDMHQHITELELVGTEVARDGTTHCIRTITARDGTEYTFRTPRQGKGSIATGIGAFLTGLLGVGIGEVVMPQLVKRNQVPVAVAAATSVFVVIVVVAAASFTQIAALVTEGGLQAVPWNAVIYTIPAVIIGGQIGPRLQGKVSQRNMEQGIGYLFLVIGLAMGFIAIRNSVF